MSDCVFCEIAAGRLEASEICRDELVIAFMDIYPWRPAHALVAVKRHVRSVSDLSGPERDRLFAVTAHVARAMRGSRLGCDDMHIVVNDGPAASQSIPHVHVHLVPRWRGDTWKLALRLLRHPLKRLTRPAPRAELDRQAAEIHAALR